MQMRDDTVRGKNAKAGEQYFVFIFAANFNHKRRVVVVHLPTETSSACRKICQRAFLCHLRRALSSPTPGIVGWSTFCHNAQCECTLLVVQRSFFLFVGLMTYLASCGIIESPRQPRLADRFLIKDKTIRQHDCNDTHSTSHDLMHGCMSDSAA